MGEVTQDVTIEMLEKLADGNYKRKNLKAANVKMADNTTVEEKVMSHLADFTQQIPYAVSTGSANTYVVSTNPALPALVAGVAITVKFHAVNTGASTLNWDTKGAKAIKNPDGTDVASGDLNGVFTLRFDGVNFILQGKGGGPNKVGSNTVITPSTADQAFPKGYYGGALTDGKVVGDADLIPSNIKSGINIFGVNGNVIPRKYANGSLAVTAGTNYVISGLTFAPSIILAKVSGFLIYISLTVEIVDGQGIKGIRASNGYSWSPIYQSDTINTLTSDGFKVTPTSSGTLYWEAWG